MQIYDLRVVCTFPFYSYHFWYILFSVISTLRGIRWSQKLQGQPFFLRLCPILHWLIVLIEPDLTTVLIPITYVQSPGKNLVSITLPSMGKVQEVRPTTVWCKSIVEPLRIYEENILPLTRISFTQARACVFMLVLCFYGVILTNMV